MPNIPTSENPLEWALGEQAAAAKEANLTLEDWQAQQRAVHEQKGPDLYFDTAGPDATEEQDVE